MNILNKLPWKRPRLDDSQLQHFINTTTTVLKRSMTSLYGQSHDGKRDLVKVYGYPSEGEMSFSYFWTQWKMNGVANRIVNMPARSCWRDGAFLKETKEATEEIFTEEVQALDRVGLFDALEKADILNRLGDFSVLYIGLPDANDLTEPITKTSGKIEDIYFAPYNEDSVTISSYITEKTDPRFGLPKTYTLTPASTTSSDTMPEQRNTLEVHWSRVVHMAEGSLDNGLVGLPALKPIINRVLDLDKTVGGAAEAFFRNASQKKVLDIDNEFTAKEGELEGFNDSAQEWLNGWKDFLGMRGAKVRALEVPTADPGPATDSAWEFIAGYTGVSRRIWTGEGSGQLTGNEDKASFNQIISDRQKQLCAGWLLQALWAIEQAGLITMPAKFVVCWPLPTAMDEKTESEVDLNEAKAAEARSRAIAAYVMALGADSIIGPRDFLTSIVGMEREEVEKLTTELDGIRRDGDGDDADQTG